MSERGPSQQLWTPETHPRHLYEAPHREELKAFWYERHSHDSLLELPEEIYGVCRRPDTTPVAIASIDLCEVVRETALSIARMKNGDIEHFVHDENEIVDYGASHVGLNEDGLLGSIIQELMEMEHVPPVPYGEAIASVLRTWRAQHVYVVANTSTLEGCELTTVKFLAEHYPDCFDGVTFPRNHDGNGKITKAQALDAVYQAIGYEGHDIQNVPAVMVEDTSHHAKAFREHFPDSTVFMPAYEWNRSCEDPALGITRVDRALGTAGAFLAAHEYMASLAGRTD
jgi:hypothetical protein